MKYVHMAQHNAVQRQGKVVQLVESSAVHFSRSQLRLWRGKKALEIVIQKLREFLNTLT